MREGREGGRERKKCIQRVIPKSFTNHPLGLFPTVKHNFMIGELTLIYDR